MSPEGSRILFARLERVPFLAVQGGADPVAAGGGYFWAATPSPHIHLPSGFRGSSMSRALMSRTVLYSILNAVCILYLFILNTLGKERQMQLSICCLHHLAISDVCRM